MVIKLPQILLKSARKGKEPMEDIRKRLQQIFLSADFQNTANPITLYESQKTDGSWDDIGYTNKTRSLWEAYLHLSRTFAMAKVFRDKNSEFYLDHRISSAVCAAMKWWIDNDPVNPNWWWNVIGVPRIMGGIVILMADAFRTRELKAVMPILKRRVNARTGQNLLWALVQQIIYASLEESEPAMLDASRQIAGLVTMSPLGQEGIQADGSFHQHGSVLYSGSYGSAFVSDCGLLLYVLNNTRFALPPDCLKNLETLMLDGVQWMYRGPTFDYGIKGRAISRRETQLQKLKYSESLPGMNIIEVFRLMCDISTERRKEFRRATDRYEKIIAGEPDPGIGGIRYFWQSDFLVQNTKDFYISVRMHSSRVDNTDSPHNGEGLKSHYIADGCTFIMRSGLEYYRIFPCWDWQKIPGTTELQTLEPLSAENVRRQGTSAFVGGMGGTHYGMACMDFLRDTLKAHKAWFLSPQGLLALGSGISCTQAGDVETTVNQCLLKGTVRVQSKTGIQTMKSNSCQILETPCKIEHDNIVYSFPEQPARVYVSSFSRTGDWFDINSGNFKPSTLHTCEVFMLSLLHGATPQSGNYVYQILPNAIFASIKTEACDVDIIQNTNICQAAVYSDKTAGILVCQAVFHKAGALTFGAGVRLIVDKPCMIRLFEKIGIEKDHKTLEITLANPAHDPLQVTVTVCQLLEDRETEWHKERMSVSLPEADRSGTSVTCFLRLPVKKI